MSALLFTMSFRVWHPTRAASDVISVLNLPVWFAHSVGEPRRTPKGAPLAGVYGETYCCFLLQEKTRDRLDKCVARWCELLQTHDDFLQDFRHTGGKIEFYVSIFLDDDRGFELNNEMLKRMDDAGLGLSIEMYRLGNSELGKIEDGT